MKYILHMEPEYSYESCYILEDMFSGTGIEHWKEEIIKKHNGNITESDLEPIFREPLSLKEYIHNNLSFDIPGYEDLGETDAEFLFKKGEKLDNCFASIFYLYNCYLANGIDDKVMAILAASMQDYGVEHELEVNPHNITCEAELFKLIDESNLDVTVKYGILKVYHNFDAYYRYYERLIENVSNMIKDMLPIFKDKITRCMSHLDNGLKTKGVKYFTELCGIGISEDLEYEIYPLVYRVRQIAFIGSNIVNGQINVGICFFDLADIIANTRSYKDLLLDFLKILSDNTKLSILQILKESPCYGGQLAEMLGLTGATISYHMAALNKLELVFISKEAAKIYYSLNKDKVLHYIEGVRSLLIS